MKKFQATIHFEMDEDFGAKIPEHRAYINRLIERGIIDQYVVSMETQRVWITFSADNKSQIESYVSGSPIYKYFTIEIDELFVIDGLHYRLPSLQMN